MNLSIFLLLSLALITSTAWADENTSDIKLYTLDCGTMAVSDMKDLSNNGSYNGQQIELANPCFLIRHPKGDLLWDTGLTDSIADHANGETSGVWHYQLKDKLVDQLKLLKISADDIEYLALSHIHPDHSGNANHFKNSTFIINKLEREYMFSKPINAIFGESYSALKQANTITFDAEHDVFNDGTVLIKAMPGHTPGSSVLLVHLANSGNVLLTGDLYIHARGRKLGTMHKYNVDKQLTRASRKQFEALAKQKNARVIIQHEKQDVDRLPKLPSYLD
ncbi:MBL fold metallo-hydrolase [Thalassotalea insulae]|uniref:MBL fold metallo-hydrolase n=1 Tax=Thalassotalea insulae TaxID=2056778 RepID=A0ABQ6GT43_9GAMM|nr:N-acyl homoserine lactonase family protein [Thalassotalea insulae]GLX78809.1 MBL fold metallo-hydrolase [Thalassotalea insulae]